MLEFDVLILPLNDDLQNQLKAKADDGWILVPGTIPRGIYQICRPIQQQAPTEAKMSGFGKLSIDESKIHIIDKDGNRVERH